MTNNLSQRLLFDINQNKPEEFKNLSFDLIGENHRPLSSWIGGSLLGSIATFQSLKIKKSEFEESTEDRMSFLFKRTI